MVKLAPNDQLRAAREGRHLSREQLADLIGASKLNVGRWERGDAPPGHPFMQKLCALFAMSPEELGFPLVSQEYSSRCARCHLRSRYSSCAARGPGWTRTATCGGQALLAGGRKCCPYRPQWLAWRR